MLATNVAETSLTVPGIRYVVDPGTARISRYSHRLKVQRLPIEPVSQASANQRKGRCGRTSDGICIRLYSEEDFDGRPEFTEPEILRTNLASVILQMTALGLGDIAAFPFVEPPDRRSVPTASTLLHELGALDAGPARTARRLTPLGRQLAAAAGRPAAGPDGARGRRATAASREVLVIAAALSIQDPRERPAGAPAGRPTSSTPGSPTRTPTSSPTSTCGTTCRSSSRSCPPTSSAGCAGPSSSTTCGCASGRTCTSQLRQVARALGITVTGARAGRRRQTIHVVAAGRPALPHRACEDAGERPEYLGARGARFAIFPGSALFQQARRAG